MFIRNEIMNDHDHECFIKILVCRVEPLYFQIASVANLKYFVPVCNLATFFFYSTVVHFLYLLNKINGKLLMSNTVNKYEWNATF